MNPEDEDLKRGFIGPLVTPDTDDDFNIMLNELKRRKTELTITPPGLQWRTTKNGHHFPGEKIPFKSSSEQSSDAVNYASVTAAKNVALNLDKEIMNAISGNTTSYNNSIEMSLEKIISATPNEMILKHLLRKMGRWVRDRDTKSIFDYLSRKSLSIHREPVKPITTDPETIEHVKEQLEQLPCVKVTVLLDDYPTSASIIVKVNVNEMDEQEAENISDRIHDVITMAKPKGLEDLEVIYHHKEVY